MALKGVIFDCDGLLIDTETPEFETWQEVFEAHGTTLSRTFWQTIIGSGAGFDIYAILESQCGHPVDREAIRSARRPRHEAMIRAGGLLPGVLKAIQTAQRMKLKLALASSSSAAWVNWCLDSFELRSYFDVVVTKDDVSVTKPDPELYLLALDRLGLVASEAIALEDSANGVRAAVRAGIFCIVVPNPMTADMDLSHASRQLDSLEALDLPALSAEF